MASSRPPASSTQGTIPAASQTAGRRVSHIGQPQTDAPPGDDDGGDDDGVGCDCAALSICLANSGGHACFPQQNCQSIEADVSNCQRFGGGAACVAKFCQTDSSAEATKEKLSAGDDVGITVAVLLVLCIALLVGLVIAKHKQGQDAMPERPAPDQK
jgi:hypothetical protein